MAVRKGYTVLLVEDDPSHAILAHAAFTYVDPSVQLQSCRTAEEAIAYLRGRWPDTDWGRSRLPDVIVLDLEMPGMGGMGFLEWYAENPQFGRIPVVVLTGTGPERNERCMQLGAKAYLEKSANFVTLVNLVSRYVIEPDEPKERPTSDAG